MPLYEYECKCGRVQTFICSAESRPKTQPCESCGKRAKYRVSTCAFVIHGGAGEGKRVKMQLEKRQADHERTPKAKEERRQHIKKLGDKGYPVW